MSPKNLLYAKTHEWVRIETEGGAKVATLGQGTCSGTHAEAPSLNRLATLRGSVPQRFREASLNYNKFFALRSNHSALNNPNNSKNNGNTFHTMNGGPGAFTGTRLPVGSSSSILSAPLRL